MLIHRAERVFVTLCGFFVGAMLAMCVAPGDVVLTIAAGIALTIFANAFFIRELGGSLFWSSGRGRSDLFISPLRHLVSRSGGSRTPAAHGELADSRGSRERLTFRKAHRHGN